MGVTHRKSTKKPSGGRLRRSREKKKHEMGRTAINTTIDADEKKQSVKNQRTRGGNIKVKVETTCYANVIDPATHTGKKVRVITEKENPANRNYARRNIMTKGAVIETEMGIARVTSRPGQDGTVNAVLTEKKK